MGDFTQVAEEDAESKGDLEVREIHNVNGSNLDEVMQMLDLSVKLEVPSLFTGQRQEVHYKINGMADLAPDAIARRLPDVQALMEMRRMLTQLQSDLANQRALGKELKKIAADEELHKGLTDTLTADNFADFTIPEAPAADEEGSEG
jgi:type VI secretion system protein ImpB